MAATHLCLACTCIPPTIRQKISMLKEKGHGVGAGGKSYWADAASALGLKETGNGLKIDRK